MSTTVTSAREIPKAPYYVLANDKFMSGWGHAEGRINTVILPCETWAEAQVVEANASGRDDMRYVRIVTGKPRLRDGVLYSLMNRESASPWYTPGTWR